MLSGVAAGKSDEHLRTERAARLFVDDVYAPASPDRRVELSIRALTAGGAPVAALEASDFLVREDEQRIDPDDVEVQILEDAKTGVACVLAIDLSPTMRESFAGVKAAANGFLERLGSYDRVAVVTFAGSIDEQADFSASRADARRAIDALAVNQEPAPTRVLDGLYRAVEMIRRKQADLPRRSLVIVFSDGNDGGSEHSLEQIVEYAKGGPLEPRVLIFPVGYATGFGESGMESLRRIAEGTTAEFVRAEPERPPTEFYGAVWKQMMKSYVVRFRSNLDGENHRVEVSVDGAAKDASHGALRPRRRRSLALAGGRIRHGARRWAARRPGFSSRRAGRLAFQSGAQRGKKVSLRRGLNRIGQQEDGEVVLPFDTVSRRHAEIEVSKGGRVLIRDLDSTNGTWVNDKRVEGPEHVACRGSRADCRRGARVRTMSEATPTAFQIASLSDVGRKRHTNQDHCGDFTGSAGERLLVLCDGMGGHQGGEVASQLAVATIGEVVAAGGAPQEELLRKGIARRTSGCARARPRKPACSAWEPPRSRCSSMGATPCGSPTWATAAPIAFGRGASSSSPRITRSWPSSCGAG